MVSIATIGTAAYNIVVSNFYLGAWYQGLLFALLAIAVAFGRAYWIKLGQIPVAKNSAYLVVSVVVAAAFAAIRNMPV